MVCVLSTRVLFLSLTQCWDSSHWHACTACALQLLSIRHKLCIVAAAQRVRPGHISFCPGCTNSALWLLDRVYDLDTVVAVHFVRSGHG